MTDKEKIEIDGVDVGGCCYAILPKNQCPAKIKPYAKETSCIACKEHNTKLNFCKNNPNCYFKQLSRKTAECEELKKTVLTKCPNCNSEYLTPKGIELYEENRKLEQKCCELTVENEKLRSSLSNSLIFRFAIQAIKSNVKYDQALDEIEKYCNKVEIEDNLYNSRHLVNGEIVAEVANNILAIINKAKDGNE